MAFAHSNAFDQQKPFYKNDATVSFVVPTDDLRQLVRAATSMIDHIYKEGVEFKKCGVILTGLEHKDSYNYDLLTDYSDLEKTEKLMKAIESVQSNFGKNKIGFGGSMFKNRMWSLSANHQTQNYFSFDGLLKINN